MQTNDLGILISILTAIVAIVISLYNYFLIRKGAKLVIGEIVEIGVMKSTSSQLQLTQIMCYFPLYFFNSGFTEAMITSIDITILNDDKKIPLFLTKRIRGRKFESIESLNPLLPVFINEKSGKMEFFEFMTKEVKLEKIDKIKVSIDYNNKRTTQEFKIDITGEDIKEFPSLNWVNLYGKDQGYPKPLLFGKDMN